MSLVSRDYEDEIQRPLRNAVLGELHLNFSAVLREYRARFPASELPYLERTLFVVGGTKRAHGEMHGEVSMLASSPSRRAIDGTRLRRRSARRPVPTCPASRVPPRRQSRVGCPSASV